jgi:hypothetical protein
MCSSRCSSKSKKSKKPSFVVYEGKDEVLVTTPAREVEMLQEWFGPPERPYRNPDEYERNVSTETGIRVVNKGLRVEL